MSACAKKSVVPASPVTVIVMDTTQALLDKAELRIGKNVLSTSFDGRVIVPENMLTKARSFTVACEGYQTRKITLDGSSMMLVQLTPKKSSRKDSREPEFRTLGAVKTGLRYDKSMVLMATADYAVMDAMEEMEMPAFDGVPNDVSAGLLTAGEVNDFTKWALWNTYLQSAERYRQAWRLTPRHRYTVQVKNREGFPVANYPVSLYDTNGNTLFQAVTDNTGKAELWAALTSDGMNELTVREPETTIIVDEPCQPAGADETSSEVDVLFIFDATGSMGDELRYLQAEMNDVIARASAATGGLRIRTGAVVYRDHGDEYLTRLSRLTDDISITQAFIDKQEANGGGDYEEAVPEALMAGLNSAGWNEQARARIAFLILDAPCHQDSATLALLHEQILNAAALGVRLVPVVCSGLGESGEYLMRSIALATNGTSFFLTDDSGIGHEHLKPSTDSLVVEHLNDMLVRTIVEFSYMPDCNDEGVNELTDEGMNGAFLPNPFDEKDLALDPSIPHGEGVYYLLDVSGKVLGVFEGEVNTHQLPIGVYFIKAYVDGQWYTKKILVR